MQSCREIRWRPFGGTRTVEGRHFGGKMKAKRDNCDGSILNFVMTRRYDAYEEEMSRFNDG